MSGEYVKRSDALQAVGDIHPLDYNGQGIVERIKAIPAADVVEVVRCGDCENWDTDWVPSHAGKGQYFCPILGQVTDTDFYCGCGCGKRKDGGQDDV